MSDVELTRLANDIKTSTDPFDVLVKAQELAELVTAKMSDASRQAERFQHTKSREDAAALLEAAEAAIVYGDEVVIVADHILATQRELARQVGADPTQAGSVDEHTEQLRQIQESSARIREATDQMKRNIGPVRRAIERMLERVRGGGA